MNAVPQPAAIEAVLDAQVRPLLRLHGGNVRLVQYADGVVSVALTGQCSGCASADATVTNLISAELKKAFAGVTEVRMVDGVSDALLADARRILARRHARRSGVGERAMEREAYIYSLFPELERVTDRTLGQKAVELWLWFWDHSSYRDLESAPFKSGSASLRLIGHVQSVVKSAVGMADTVMRVQHVRLDMDLLIVTAVLHDVSKLIEYEEDADGRAQFTYRGAHFPHAFWGAQKAAEFGLPDAVAAGILTHPASCPTQQNTNESILLQHADIASACMQ